MERVRSTTTCRCGYASPSTLVRCLGCGRRFVRCERAAPATAATPSGGLVPASLTSAAHDLEWLAEPPPCRRVEVVPSAFSGRDAERFGIASQPATSALPSAPFGPVAVLGLLAAAWIEPDAPRVEILTAAAILGAGLAAMRPAAATAASTSPPSTPAVALPTRLTDDELRDALAAW